MADTSVPGDVLHGLQDIAPYFEAQPAAAATSPVTQEGASAVGAVETAASAVPDFLSRLTSRNLWLRVLKIVAGVVLIITGLVQLTHAGQLIGSAGKVAGSLA
jgi:hypothetical protein